MNVHMYIEANPLLTKKASKNEILMRLKTLHQNIHCSYGYYAYGIESEYTKALTIPSWYLDLGPNAKIRQLRYRKIFLDYILKEITFELKNSYFMLFIGSTDWVTSQKKRCKDHFQKNDS